MSFLVRTNQLRSQFVFLSFVTILSISSASSPSSDALVSPVSNFGPSWTASAVRTTSVAVSCTTSDQQPAVIVLLQPGSSTNSQFSNDDIIEKDGLNLQVHLPDRKKVSDRWTLVGSNALCCMTGLAADVDYLSRVLLKHAERHRIVYEGSRTLPALEVVQLLAQYLRKETQSQGGGRPYGIQALVISPTTTTSTTTSTTNSKNSQLAVFTQDPSGSVRHWGCATAIGKGATAVRKRLYEALKNEDVAELDAVAALRLALTGLLDKEDLPPDPTLEDLPEALLVWKHCDNGIRIASIQAENVLECQKEAMSRIRAAPTSN